MEIKMEQDEGLETNLRDYYEALPVEVKALSEAMSPDTKYAVSAIAAYNAALQTADEKQKQMLPYAGILVFLDVLRKSEGDEDYLNAAKQLFTDYIKETSGWNEEKINKYFQLAEEKGGSAK
jgi:hypothetical protein